MCFNYSNISVIDNEIDHIQLLSSLDLTQQYKNSCWYISIIAMWIARFR